VFIHNISTPRKRHLPFSRRRTQCLFIFVPYFAHTARPDIQTWKDSILTICLIGQPSKPGHRITHHGTAFHFVAPGSFIESGPPSLGSNSNIPSAPQYTVAPHCHFHISVTTESSGLPPPVFLHFQSGQQLIYSRPASVLEAGNETPADLIMNHGGKDRSWNLEESIRITRQLLRDEALIIALTPKWTYCGCTTYRRV
jgi:hypothetical protein